MSRRIVAALSLCLCLAGCATHRYRVEKSTVTLMLRAPQAGTVTLLCSLGDFAERPATRQGAWWLVTLPSGSAFRYVYRVDGTLFLPDCSQRETDDFGAENCIFDPSL